MGHSGRGFPLPLGDGGKKSRHTFLISREGFEVWMIYHKWRLWKEIKVPIKTGEGEGY